MLNVASEQAPVEETPERSARTPRDVVGSVAVWLVPALVAFGVGWWGILRVGISRDESATIDISTRSLPQIWRMVQHADAVHALYYGILHFWTEAFGISLLSIRLPSLIGTAIAAAALAVLGRMLVSPWAGFAAGLLYACSPEISSFAHDARSYGMDSALVVALVIVFVYALRSRRRRPWIGYALMLLVTVVAHLFTLLIVPAQGITVLWYAWTRRDWLPLRRWLVSTAVALAALSPFLSRAISQGGTASWIPPLTRHAVALFAADLAGGVYLIGPVIVLSACAIGIRRQPPGDGDTPSVVKIALPWLAVPPALLFAYSIHVPLYVFRYLLYCLPALNLLTAAGMQRLNRVLRVVVLLALIAATIPLQLAVRDRNIGANDFGGEAAYISAAKRPGDALVFLVPTQRELASSDRPAYAGLDDIAEAQTPAQAANFSGTDVPTGVLRQRLGAVDRVWAVKYWVSKAGRPAAHVVENRRYALLKAAGLRWVSTRRFRGGAILLFQRPGTS
jgi:mannosyltransferase